MNKVLVIAPHADDELIGVGGTILKYLSNGDEVYICIVTRGYPPIFSSESTAQTKGEARLCHEYMGITKTIFLDFPSVLLEKEKRYEINDKMCEMMQDIKPDIVYIPHYGDMMMDHQIVVESAMVSLRPKYKHVVRKIYGYETLSETGWNVPNIQNEFIPNSFVDISGFLDEKLKCLSFYKDQICSFPGTRSLEAVMHLARYRGTVMGLEAAEAFMLVREIN